LRWCCHVRQPESTLLPAAGHPTSRKAREVGQPLPCFPFIFY
jgi:hypothetical protein